MASSRVTTLSTKEQLILPKTFRERRKWGPGTRLVVEDTADGVLIRPEPRFPVTRHEDVARSVKCDRPPISIEGPIAKQKVTLLAAQTGWSSHDD